MKIALLQPFIPHYREAFFSGLKAKKSLDLFCYESKTKVQSNSFKLSDIRQNSIKNIVIGPFLIYSPSVFLSKEYKQLVLMWHFGHITTWLLLMTKFIHKKEIVLWGQGISVKRYLKEEQNPSVLLKWMLAMADGVWFYTEKEKKQWQHLFPNKRMVSLNNTISGIENIIAYKSVKSKSVLKQEYNIAQELCFIFCARFNNNYRRQDLLIEVIEKLDSSKHGFLIIGDGPTKPDFSKYKNVYDFGAVYSEVKKQDLFTISDLYIQPGWVGLSIVEAMGYGKAIITFKRSKNILQCVEYSYLEDNKNAFLFNSVDELILKTEKISIEEIKKMNFSAKQFVIENLIMPKMVENAVTLLWT